MVRQKDKEPPAPKPAPTARPFRAGHLPMGIYRTDAPEPTVELMAVAFCMWVGTGLIILSVVALAVAALVYL